MVCLLVSVFMIERPTDLSTHLVSDVRAQLSAQSTMDEEGWFDVSHLSDGITLSDLEQVRVAYQET